MSLSTRPSLLIFAAPSGAGKTTIVRHLLERFSAQFAFSVSATTRAPRAGERDGTDYYFLTVEAFETRLAAGEFVEYEEVYAGQYYGTLRSEVTRIQREGKCVLFDIDVKGAVHLKSIYGDAALTVFVKAPSLEVLAERLAKRHSESPESLAKRLAHATAEMTYEHQFDEVLVNDDLAHAFAEAERIAKLVNSEQ